MDLTTATSTRTTPDSESDTPPRPTPTKPMGFLAYTNGALTKRHYPTAPKPGSPATARSPPVSYKECMRNHAASLGGHALDGCCEFMPSPQFNPADPTSLRCAACGCHRNFHRRDPDDPAPLQLHRQIKTPPTPTIPPPFHRPAPPPTFSSGPHMLLAHRGSISGGVAAAADGGSGGKKRFRTRFTEEQKSKMLKFAERLGWKMQKVDKGVVEGFCNEVGVGREVLKVWMHNNKTTLGRKEAISNGGVVVVDETVAATTTTTNGGVHHHLVSANASSSSE